MDLKENPRRVFLFFIEFNLGWEAVIVEENNKNIRVSKLSIAAFCSWILGVITIAGSSILSINTSIIPSGTEYLIPVIAFVFGLAAFVMSIIDLFKKERKKVLSIITLVLSAVPTLLFGLVLLIVQFYASSPR